MHTQTIINPKTNRKNAVKCWNVETRKVIDILRNGNIKDVSWALLSDNESIEAMEETQHEDSGRTNFALNIFENALDWRLGIAVVNVIKGIKAQTGKYPTRFTIAANRNGDLFFIGKAGAATLISQ